MAIVFDEVEGTVQQDPETSETALEGSGETQAKPVGVDEIQIGLERDQRRRGRLVAN